MHQFYILPLLIASSFAFSNSVPATRPVCRMMVPGHRAKPQTSISPFNVTSNKLEVKAGGSMEITISGQGQKFKGFYIQVRDAKDTPIGTFKPNTIVKTHGCSGIKSNAAHHGGNDEKSQVQVNWVAPANYQGKVRIRATVVQNYLTFWTPLITNEITIMK